MSNGFAVSAILWLLTITLVIATLSPPSERSQEDDRHESDPG